MTLKTETVRIQAKNRDENKTFLIEELPAYDVEWWSMRALLAMVRNKPELLDTIQAGSGTAALIQMGLKSFLSLNPEDLKPLWDDMLRCVKIIRDPKYPHVTSAVTPQDIEEVTTLFRLRSEVIKIHTGFSIPGVL